ncbi:MAG: hypothetical protein K0S41_831 [Anaerocolumna sp.]|jgi:hypothetical protein|nr:hypothetical protein [Anaerocolumna sp.]
MDEIIDKYGRKLHVVTIDNGCMSFTVLPERGMDIGDIYINGEKVSWETPEGELLHPDSVDLKEQGAWDKGFVASVSTIGPEIFGTPDEIRTVHGTGAYSTVDLSTFCVNESKDEIEVLGNVTIRGYEKNPVYKKEIRIVTKRNSTFLTRFERTINLTDDRQHIDDGFHIQPAGAFVSKGGRYVIPVKSEHMLLRDSAPAEEDPLKIYDYSMPLDPIRCYQYVPEEVRGLEMLPLPNTHHVTAEMLVDDRWTMAAVLVRPLGVFPRSLIAKRAKGKPMYAIEPCKTRPNSIKQKSIDGELMYLNPHESMDSWITLGYLMDQKEIKEVAQRIEEAKG